MVPIDLAPRAMIKAIKARGADALAPEIKPEGVAVPVVNKV